MDPESTTPSGMIDLAFLKVYSGGNKELMKKFIRSFLEKTPASIKILDEQLAAKDYQGLNRTAHSLKPQLSYMGIAKASDIAKAIEESSKEMQNAEAISMQLEELKALLSNSYIELQQQLNQL